MPAPARKVTLKPSLMRFTTLDRGRVSNNDAVLGAPPLTDAQHRLREMLHGWHHVAHQQRLQAVRWQRLRELEVSYDTAAREQNQSFTMLQCTFFKLREHARSAVEARRRAEEAGVAGLAEQRFWDKQAERLNRQNRGKRATAIAAEVRLAALGATARSDGASMGGKVALVAAAPRQRPPWPCERCVSLKRGCAKSGK